MSKKLKEPLPEGRHPQHNETLVFSRTLWGDPQPKGRPRTFRNKHGRIVTITPRPTFEWEAFHANAIRLSLQRPTIPRHVPLSFGAVIVWKRPKNRPRYVPLERWRTGSRWYHPVKPDGDNVIKTIWDTLKRARVYDDDSQIVRCSFSDWIAARGEKPHVKIWICEINVEGDK